MGTAANRDPARVDETTPLYNSRIIATYLDFLKKYRSEVEVDSILRSAGISRYEIRDPAHWFSQREIERFHEALEEAVSDPAIARSAGRYVASAENLGPLRAFMLGLINPATAYLLIRRISAQLSRGAAFAVKRTGRSSVEITSRPVPGVREKPFQCENRLGSFEGMALALTGRLAEVSHPECLHRGGACCRYRVSWSRTPALNWKLARNLALFAAVIGGLAGWMLLPKAPFHSLISTAAAAVAAVAFLSERAHNRELSRTLKAQGNVGRDLVEESNIRYGNALLVQEIGQAAANIRDRFELIRAVIGAVEKRLDYDRGMILLADEQRRRLNFVDGFGYSSKTEPLLVNTSFRLHRRESMGLLVRCFREQRPFLVDDIERIKDDFSDRSRRFVDKVGAKELICVPIVYEKTSYGVLAVDNIRSKRRLKKSDVNLLMAVASQTAASIANANAFERLLRSEEKYRSIIENIQEGYFEIDRRGNLTFFNDTLCRIAGQSAASLMDLNYRTLISDRDARRIDTVFQGLLRNGSVLKSERFEALRADGKIRHVEVSASPIREAGGSVSGIRGLVRDVTERQEAEKHRKKLEAQLAHAQKMEAVGTLAGGVAHDFNNMLTVIQGNASIMLMGMDPSDPLYEKLKSIEAYIQKSARLTQQLLGFARKGKYKIEPVNMNELIEKSSELIGRTRKDVRITQKLAEVLWTVSADPGQMEQVLINLYVNALHAMPRGGRIVLETSCVELGRTKEPPLGLKPGRYVKIRVEDTGVGMSEEVRRRIFDPFFTTKRPGEGTGLGLASAYGILNNHGGGIDVSSTPGVGTTFWIYLPAAENDNETEDASPKDQVLYGRETLLVIDDEKRVLDIVSEMLEKLGYRVVMATGGPEGIDLFRRGNIDLVILDMVMPEMSGVEVFEELRKIDPRIGILLASGYSAEGEASMILKAGNQEFVQKPFDIEKLSLKIRLLLDGATNSVYPGLDPGAV